MPRCRVGDRPLLRGAGAAAANKNEFSFKLTFYSADRMGAAGAVPTKLVWEFTTGTQELSIPLEFTDIPMP